MLADTSEMLNDVETLQSYEKTFPAPAASWSARSAFSFSPVLRLRSRTGVNRRSGAPDADPLQVKGNAFLVFIFVITTITVAVQKPSHMFEDDIQRGLIVFCDASSTASAITPA